MFVLIGIIKIHLPYAHSLKEKRKTAKSLSAKLYKRHKASVREIDLQDLQQMLALGFSYTALSETEAQNIIDEIENTIWLTIESEGELVSLETDIIHGFGDFY